MKTPLRLTAFLSICLGAIPLARGEVLDSLAEYGNAATANATSGAGTPRGFTNPAAGQYTITAGGTDFWGATDNGSMIYDADQVQSGNFSAIVRSVSVAGDAAEALAGEWGRTGLMARKTTTAGNSANVMHFRKSGGNPAGTDPADTVIGGRPTDGAGTDRGPNENGEFRNFAANTANGSVRNTPIWLGLHRFGGQYYATWAPDVAGSPGTWSPSITRAGTPDTQGDVSVGLIHQSHNIHPAVNTAAFEAFNVGAFDASLGQFAFTSSGDIALNGNEVYLTASKSELGDPTPRDVNWEVRYIGSNVVPTPGGLMADIYLQPNGGNLGAFNTLTAGPPNGTTRISRINWGSNDYTQTNPGGVNLFAEAVPGSFGGNQDNYAVHLTGEIYIPSDADRGGLEAVAFHDGVDDYTLLQVDGVTLIDDNTWTNRAGDANAGGGQGILDVSAAKYNDGEWVSFRMGTWEGGGGDDANLVWDALDRTGTDSTTGGTDATLNSYTGAGAGMSGGTVFTNHVSDEVPPVNFRSLGQEVTLVLSGTGQPANLRLTDLPVGTRALELYLDGVLFSTTPTEPTVASADFTSHSVVTIELVDAGGGGTSDVDESTLTVLRDGVAISPMITKSGQITTIVDTFAPEPAPFTQFSYTVSGMTTAATGGASFEQSVNLRSFAIISELRAGLAPAPNATAGWQYMEFAGATLGGGAQGYRDAQTIIRDAGAPTAEGTVPFVNHNDPETNGAGSGDWVPDMPILSNTPGDDNNYVTFARTVVTLPAGAEGTYTLRIRGDDGYGIRVNGATAVSVAGSNVNKVDSRDSSIFFPEFTGDSNAFAVFNLPTAGDYLVEFFGFEGGGGSFQEISWAAGARTSLQQSSTWALLGDTSGITPTTFNSVWGVIPESVTPALPTESPGGWGVHLWYGARNGANQLVGNLDQTVRFLRDLDAGTATFGTEFLGFLPELNHSDPDTNANAGVFNPTAPFPGDTPGDTNNIAMLAHALLVAPADGIYTIQIRSDDGLLFRFVDPLDQFLGINGPGQLHPSYLREITHPAGTGDTNTRATVFLTEGAHEVLYVWWEGGGGAHFEVSSAPGDTRTNGGGAPTYQLITDAMSATHLYTGLNLPPDFRITAISYDRNTQMVTLTWDSQPGRVYGIYFSQDLIAPAFGGDINDNVPSGGTTTTATFDLNTTFGVGTVPTALFFRVQDNGAAP